MAEELKPCPFCGSEAEVVVGETCFIESFAVYCKECSAKLGVSGRLCEVYEWTPRFDTREAAIEAWNTRAERTCTLHKTLYEPSTLEHMQEYECSECGGLTNAQVLDKRDEPRYCARCGARITEAVSDVD